MSVTDIESITDESYFSDDEYEASSATDESTILEEETMFSDFRVTGDSTNVTITFFDFREQRWVATLQAQDICYTENGDFKALMYCVCKSASENTDAWNYRIIGMEYEGNETRLIIRETFDDRRRFFIGLTAC